MEFLCRETREYYSAEVKPSVDPVVLFKLYLLGYLFGQDPSTFPKDIDDKEVGKLLRHPQMSCKLSIPYSAAAISKSFDHSFEKEAPDPSLFTGGYRQKAGFPLLSPGGSHAEN